MMRKVAALFLFTLVLGGCALLEPAPAPEAVLDSAVSGTEGIAQVNAGGAALEFTTIDGISGERVAGIEVQVAAAGGARMVYAADPSGAHVPVAVPLPGTAAVRRLVMPPATDLGYNITTAAGSIDPLLLEPLGLLDEGQIRNRMRSAGDFAVLIYQYNPDQPLALTNAPLEAYATPFPQVTVLRPPVMEGSGALLVAGIARGSFGSWEHILVDRYLAGRIGQPPATDLSADLDFGWAYPVFEIFPGEAEIALGTDERALLMVNWRSPNPDPPGPWVFFVSTDDEERFSVEPQSFALGPDSPPQEVIVSVNRQGLAAGDYTTTIYIQPFSEAFGVIEQTAQRTLSFAVAEVIPTPTLGPQAEVAFVPTTPREGDVLTVNAAGFTPGEAVLITFEGGAQSFQDSQSTADTEGLFRYQLDLQGVS
ncbi:MAG: hypothetical protein GYB64_11595, partial [Chloroflexi bacterium]|nr:hypothetical protein [Chloroflexota bacterium]